VSNGVVDQAAEKSNIGPGPDRNVQVGDSRCAVESWIDGNELGLTDALGFHDEAKAHRMILGRIAAHDEDDIRVRDVRPPVRHGPTAERGGQTGHRWAVSKTGLILVGHDA